MENERKDINEIEDNQNIQNKTYTSENKMNDNLNISFSIAPEKSNNNAVEEKNDAKIEAGNEQLISSSSSRLLQKRRHDNENDSETTVGKKLKLFMENTYHPNGIQRVNKFGKRLIIIDGNDVAIGHSVHKKVFSVEGLDICIRHFEMLGHRVKAVVPLHCNQYGRATNRWRLRELQKQGKIIFTPCKNLPNIKASSNDDKFIMYLAIGLDGVIISNDDFVDLLKEHPELKKIIHNRQLKYRWYGNSFILNRDCLQSSVSSILIRKDSK